jgi:hypothetical protein
MSVRERNNPIAWRGRDRMLALGAMSTTLREPESRRMAGLSGRIISMISEVCRG